MNIEVKVIYSFSMNGTGGNPAGVVLHADHLTSEQKQSVASKAGLSEVAFLSKSLVADFKLDFFTPTRQIPHCGHATIAAFSYLKSEGLLYNNNSSKETIDGTREIVLEGDHAYMQQSRATFIEVPDTTAILHSLGIDSTMLDPHLPIRVGNTGNSFLLVPLKNESSLSQLRPDYEQIKQISEKMDCVGYYVFAETTGEFDAQARMFAPAFGINEESATGMAAGPLASLLSTYGKRKSNAYTIGQGKYMSPASASLIKVNIDPSSGSLMVGGNAYVGQTLDITI